MGLLNKLKLRKSKPAVKRGKLIILEGIDGSGKTVQQSLLSGSLSANGHVVGSISFPSYAGSMSAPLAAFTRGELLALDPHAVATLYTLDRLSARQSVEKFLTEGKTVIANRFSASNAVYQGLGLPADERAAFYKWVYNMEHAWFGLPKPDYTFVLDMPASFASQLALKRRIEHNPEFDNKDFLSPELDRERLAELRNSYRSLSQLWPNMRLVSCVSGEKLKTPEDIHTELFTLVRRLVFKTDGLTE